MLIRKMTEDDLQEVLIIEEDSFSDPWSELGFLSSLNDDNNTCMVVELDGEIAGFFVYCRIAGEGHIYNVAVKREYRRRHIGEFMMKALLADAKSWGISQLTLEVRASNEAALRLYESLGFVKEGIRKYFYTKPTEDAVIMWLRPIQ